MQVPAQWGQQVPEMPGVFRLGGRDWVITWSPNQVHPYAAQWLQWAALFGPSGRTAPPPDLWAYGLQTR